MSSIDSANTGRPHNRLLAPYFSGAVVVFSYLAFLYYATFVWTGGWILVLFRDHYAFFVGLPLAALAAHFLVGTLENARGRIEFELVGVKFKGASGPIVMWVIVYLAIVVSFALAWNLKTQ